MGGGSRIQFPKLISLGLVHSKTELSLYYRETWLWYGDMKIGYDEMLLATVS